MTRSYVQMLERREKKGRYHFIGSSECEVSTRDGDKIGRFPLFWASIFLETITRYALHSQKVRCTLRVTTVMCQDLDLL